jgi:hypothetical protein
MDAYYREFYPEVKAKLCLPFRSSHPSLPYTGSRIATLTEVIQTASNEIGICIKNLSALSDQPATREELFAGSFPLPGAVMPEAMPVAMEMPMTAQMPVQMPMEMPMTAQIPVQMPMEMPVAPPETSPVDEALALNVMQILVDNWRSCKKNNNPIQANKLRDALRPENIPPKKGKDGYTFTHLLQLIPGVSLTSIQRSKNGKLLPPEPAFALSFEAEEYLRRTEPH